MKAPIILIVFTIFVAADDECNENGYCKYDDVVKASNSFALDLYKQACKNEKGNVMASPLSLELVLAVTASGAYGDTQTEILDALHQKSDIIKLKANFKDLLDTLDYSNVDLATQLFIGSEFQILPTFSKQAEENFKTGVQNVNFVSSADEATNAINNFISEKTNGKIEKMIQSVDPTTKLLLINTIYFKGKWASPFKPEMTRIGGPFYLSNDKKEFVKADLMYQAGSFKYLNVEELDSQLIELPFYGNKYKMMILLPNEIEGLNYVESTMKDDPQFFANFDDITERKVELTLPKMKILVNNDFKGTLRNLGVQSVFLQSANLYGIVQNDIGKLQVSSIVQKAFLDVDEAGAEAAAATSTSVSQRRSMDDLVNFNADHPFLFAIVQTSNNLVLFQGRFNKPS